MKRRAALTALVCSCGGVTRAGHAAAASLLAGHVLAWSTEGCWVASPGGGLQPLPDRLTAGTHPALTLRGLWLVDSRGALRCWAPGSNRAWQLQHTVEFATPAHALAASPNGRWVAAAHGEQLSLLDASGAVVQVLEGSNLERGLRGAATALFVLPQRRSFVVAWPALGEVWEISFDPQAAPIFDGLVHDYRMGEAIAKPGYLGARRAPLGRPLPDFSFADARVPWLAGMLGAEVVVMHLDVRRHIAALRADAAHPAGAALRRVTRRPGAFEWWLPAGHEIHVFDTARWQRTAVHTLPGPVRQVQVTDGATDAALWARVEERGGATLWQLDDPAAGAWRRMDEVAGTGPVRMIVSTSQGASMLVLRGERQATLQLEQLDSRGGRQARWMLPAATDWQGIAAWPAA